MCIPLPRKEVFCCFYVILDMHLGQDCLSKPQAEDTFQRERGRVISFYLPTLKSHNQRGSFIELQINCFVKHLSIKRWKLYVLLRLPHLLQLILVLLNGTALSQHRIHVAYGNVAGSEYDRTYNQWVVPG